MPPMRCMVHYGAVAMLSRCDRRTEQALPPIPRQMFTVYPWMDTAAVRYLHTNTGRYTKYRYYLPEHSISKYRIKKTPHTYRTAVIPRVAKKKHDITTARRLLHRPSNSSTDSCNR